MAALREKGKEAEAASLERRDLQWDHDPRLHVSHQWDCVVDIFVPAPLPPGSISSLFPRLQVFIGPEMMHNVKLSYLREEAAHCLLVLLPVLDGPSPRDGKKSVKQKLGPVQKAL